MGSPTIVPFCRIDITFGQQQNKLTIQFIQNGQVQASAQGNQNGMVPDVGPFQIFALDSADTNSNRGDFTDKTFLDQGEGIGITDGDDSSPVARKRIEGDEILGIQVGDFKTQDALINVCSG